MDDVEASALNGEINKKREMIINGNLRLVAKIAIEMSRAWPGIDVMDLIQEGNMALMRALEAYDPSKGKFTTLVGFSVRTAIMTYIKNSTGAVRLYKTTAQRKIFNKLVEIKEQYEQDGVSINEIATRFNTDPFVLEQILGSFTPIDINSITVESEEDKYIAKESLNIITDKIERFRKTLGERELVVFDENMYLGSKSLKDIGDFFGTTRSSMWNTKSRVLDKARKFFDLDDLKHIPLGEVGGELSKH